MAWTWVFKEERLRIFGFSIDLSLFVGQGTDSNVLAGGRAHQSVKVTTLQVTFDHKDA